MEKEKQQLEPGDIVTVEEAVEGLLSRCMGNPEYWLEAGVHAILVTDPRQPVTLGAVMLLSFIDSLGVRRQALVNLSDLKKVAEKEIISLERAERAYLRKEGAVSLSPLLDRTFLSPPLYERDSIEWKDSAGKYQRRKKKKRRKR